MWQRATVILILKPEKPSSNPESYHTIPLLCSSFKLFERLILNRINPITDQLLLTEQAGFLKNRSIVDQACCLTRKIVQAFNGRQVVGSVFLDLNASYDTVWHKRLNLFCIVNPLNFISVTIGVRDGEAGVLPLPRLENFQGKLCFQGKQKLLKNPEW